MAVPKVLRSTRHWKNWKQSGIVAIDSCFAIVVALQYGVTTRESSPEKSPLNTAEEIPQHSQIAVTNYGSGHCSQRLASVVLVHGVFVLVQGVFVLVHGVLGLRSSFENSWRHFRSLEASNLDHFWHWPSKTIWLLFFRVWVARDAWTWEKMGKIQKAFSCGRPPNST